MTVQTYSKEQIDAMVREIELLRAERSNHLDAISDAYYEMAFAIGDMAGHKDAVIERRAGKLDKCADRIHRFVSDSGNH